MKRKPNSAPARVAAWFAENPGEELTYKDLLIKFDLAKDRARVLVYRLEQQGLVEISPVVIRAKRPRAESTQ